MKKSLLITCLFLLSTLISCSFRGNLKGLYSYYDSTKKEVPDLLIKTNSDIHHLKYSRNVYIINGENLKKSLKDDDKSLVYIWGPKCTSKICIPLNVVQEYCTKNNLALYIVAEYYDSEQMNKAYNLDKPIFGVDTEFYNTNLVQKYLNAFIMDITQASNLNKRYLYFEKGEFKNALEEINIQNL